MSVTTPVTADQLLRMSDDGNRYELIAGEIRKMTPAGFKHGAIAGRLHGWLARHVEEQDLGLVLGAEPGFLIARDPDTVRSPDIAFVCKQRLPSPPFEEGFWPGPPDLAVEVVSPHDTLREVDEKAKAWLKTGARLVWAVDPTWSTVAVYRAARQVQVLTESEDLTGEDIVPGFRCRVGDLFKDL